MTSVQLVPPSSDLIQADVERAFAEDIGSGDATAELLPADATASATLTCRDDAVMAGIAWFNACFLRLDPQAQIDWNVRDGDRVAAGSVICRLRGNARALVTAERSALNFLQLLSGTATSTAAHVAAVAGTGVRVLDTRKTVPGLRLAQKYAVRCGGGHNHRVGLYDAILVKENHIIAAGSIKAAAEAARRLHPTLLLEIEVENLDELQQALDARSRGHRQGTCGAGDFRQRGSVNHWRVRRHGRGFHLRGCADQACTGGGFVAAVEARLS